MSVGRLLQELDGAIERLKFDLSTLEEARTLLLRLGYTADDQSFDPDGVRERSPRRSASLRATVAERRAGDAPQPWGIGRLATDDQIEEIHRLAGEKKSVRAIARAVGISRSSVQRVLTAGGIAEVRGDPHLPDRIRLTAAKLIRERGGPVRAVDVAAQLATDGVDLGEDPPKAVANALSYAKGFTRAGRGLWILVKLVSTPEEMVAKPDVREEAETVEQHPEQTSALEDPLGEGDDEDEGDPGVHTALRTDATKALEAKLRAPLDARVKRYTPEEREELQREKQAKKTPRTVADLRKAETRRRGDTPTF